jgi:hypothetical protein
MADKITYITYSKEQCNIVEKGIDLIKEVFEKGNTDEKRSLLFCLDKYLDPYYGYKLSYRKDLFLLLQKQLFKDNHIEVKEDILQLLFYSNSYSDYLGDRIDAIDAELLPYAIETLGNDYNMKYEHIFKKYLSHENIAVRIAAKEAILQLSEIKKNI